MFVPSIQDFVKTNGEESYYCKLKLKDECCIEFDIVRCCDNDSDQPTYQGQCFGYYLEYIVTGPCKTLDEAYYELIKNYLQQYHKERNLSLNDDRFPIRTTNIAGTKWTRPGLKEKNEYMICMSGYSQINLVSLDDGMNFGSAISVNEEQFITRKQFFDLFMSSLWDRFIHIDSGLNPKEWFNQKTNKYED